MYQALYRKYRPAIFDDVCGQEHITSVLKYQAANNRISHAYLFCGSRGTGKTTCAKILAKAVNCESPIDGNPCCTCPSCRAIDSASAPDVLEMDAASNNGVDYIRDIRDEVSYTPAMLKRRVYIIDEVHMLSQSAFNALLKTLEEPPEHVVFVLATTELHKLPATIISRCQRFDFRRISLPTLTERLMTIAEKEGILLELPAAQQIARQAQGGMRDAISIFELCSGGGVDVTLARTEDVLGLSGYDFLHDTVCSLANGDMKSLLGTIAEVVSSSKDISVFWQELTSFYRDMMVSKYAQNIADYLDLTERERTILTDAAERFNIQTLSYHCEILDQAMQGMQRTPQMKRTIAEFACMRMCDPMLDISAESLSARIGQLEDRLAMMEIGTPIPSAPRANTEKKQKTVEKLEPQQESPESNFVAETVQFEPVPDISDLIEKIGKIDKRVQSFLTDADILVSADGTEMCIRTANDFSARMLSDDVAKSAVSRAAALCRITSGTPAVRVEALKKENALDPAMEELYKNM